MPAPNKDLFTTRRTLRIDGSKCNSCMLCMFSCPTKNVIAIGEGRSAYVADAARCSFCLACLHRCPTHAISAETQDIASLFDTEKHAFVAPGQPGEADLFDFQ